MTDHDQNAAIGDLTKRYSEAKRKKAALLSEISKGRTALATTASILADKVENVRSGIPVTSANVPSVPEYPSPEHMKTLVDDFRDTLREVERTQKLIKEAGLDIA